MPRRISSKLTLRRGFAATFLALLIVFVLVGDGFLNLLPSQHSPPKSNSASFIVEDSPLMAKLLADPSGQKVWIKGRVVSSVKHGISATNQPIVRFNFKPQQLLWSERSVASVTQQPHFSAEFAAEFASDDLIRVSWYSSWSSPQQWPIEGQYWQLWLKLKPIWGMANPHGFDYERWAFSQGLTARAYVLSEHLSEPVAGVSSPMSDFRQQILRLFADAVDQQTWRQVALMAALSIGDRGYLTPQQWQLYQATGVAHLLAISGLHIGIVAWLGGIDFQRLVATQCLPLSNYSGGIHQIFGDDGVCWLVCFFVRLGYSCTTGVVEFVGAGVVCLESALCTTVSAVCNGRDWRCQ